MDYNDFRALVARMRTTQKEYFKTRKAYYLKLSKDLESLVDRELKKDKEPTLF